jgi:hypothetical protein
MGACWPRAPLDQKPVSGPESTAAVVSHTAARGHEKWACLLRLV